MNVSLNDNQLQGAHGARGAVPPGVGPGGAAAGRAVPGGAAAGEAAPRNRPLPQGARERLGFLLVQLKSGIQAWGTPAFAQLGLGHPKEAMLLMVLAADSEPRSQQALGERLRIDRTTMVSTVDALERLGAVERRRNPADRRAYLVQLTGEGRRLAAAAQRVAEELEEAFLEPLAPEEQVTLMDLLARLADARGTGPHDPA